MLLEAMAYGRQVTATQIAGAAESIAERDADIIVGRNSVEYTAEAFLRISKDDDLVARMGSSGRKLLE